MKFPPWLERRLSPPARAFLQEARRTPGYSLFDLLHGYIYARWTYLYIGIGTGEHPLARVLGPLVRLVGRLLPARPQETVDRLTLADTYHGKVVPLEAATQLVAVGEEIRLTDLERVVPYARARDIILKNPDHIAVIECPCRASRADPCEPLDVCLVIGEPFVSLILEYHPRRARRITSDEAMEILRAEAARGHVHHAFFKDAMLDRFYAICNCCSCCCGAMQAHQRGTPMLASSGYVSEVDADRCVGCGLCADACPFGAVVVGEGVAVVDRAACMGCGVCTLRCPEGALALVRDPARGEPLEIYRLLAEAEGGG
ncbi:MAG TPA: 4Fe-4S binding protein [Thermoflexia bacterium]|jgi:ferredoxin|nr:4Fe-4S binding protein [Thermoflexia bacterium]